ncbi:DUF5694 domain-containing protein [Chitinimonas sp.]|uniref:DUF5694 domain-containing protein n=1 Tax=Chitinimonas sp. TaxID=1934313 RepID=UPI002F92FC48
MKTWTSLVCGCMALLPYAAHAEVSLKGLDREMSGTRAQIAVLGTVHLRSLPDSFNPASLDPLLDKLAAFQPDIITIEAKNGEECDLAARHPAKYGADYCPSTAAAQAATGLDVPAALAEISKTLKAWPAQASPAQRRHLAALFMAANEANSANVQWLQLPPAERHAGDGLDAALVADLEKLTHRKNESNQIAARLAAHLGLQRVYAVDNHTGDNLDVADIDALGQALKAAWASGNGELKPLNQQLDALAAAPDLLPLYRMVNSPESLRIHAEANVVSTMRAQSPERYTQMWVGGWETRNLRMVANIRETFRERPGARVLTIVGVSHKPWFDSWLGQMQGVDIVDVVALLK